MLSIVPDTNILVSATITQGNEYHILKFAKLKKIKIVLSPQILKEFEDVLNYSKFEFSQKQIENILKKVTDISEIVIPINKTSIIKEDPSDNKILDTALSGKVNYIVSGDNHLLKLNKINDIKIINASQFLEILKTKN